MKWKLGLADHACLSMCRRSHAPKCDLTPDALNSTGLLTPTLLLGRLRLGLEDGRGWDAAKQE